MTRLLLPILLTLALPALAQAADITEPRSIEPFEAIEVGGGIALEAAPGTQKVEVTGSAEDVAEVLTEVSGGTLHLGWKPHLGWGTHRSATVRLAVPTLSELSCSGASRATVRGLQLQRVALSGGADLVADGVGGQLQIELSGGAHGQLSGPGVDRLAVTASGGAKLHATDLPARAAAVESSGGARVELTASETLAATLSGGSQVTVKGHPQVSSQHTSGAARLSFE